MTPNRPPEPLAPLTVSLKRETREREGSTALPTLSVIGPGGVACLGDRLWHLHLHLHLLLGGQQKGAALAAVVGAAAAVVLVVSAAEPAAVEGFGAAAAAWRGPR